MITTIKNKLIKLLGGVTIEVYTKEKEIAFLTGRKSSCTYIHIYMKDYVLNPTTDNSDLALKTCEYASSIYNEANSKLINLITN